MYAKGFQGIVQLTDTLKTHWNHPTIKNGFAVCPTVVDPIQADRRLVHVESDLLGDVGH